MDLDRIDFAILEALSDDGTLSNKELAARIDLAESTTLRRVRKLEDKGVIRGVHAEIDLRSLGVNLQAMVAVRLQKHSRELVETFEEHVRSLPRVLSIFHVAGEYDYLVHVAVRNADELRDLALDAFTTRPEVEHLETSLIFEHTQTWSVPTEIESLDNS
ncbi:MAG: Lrp/AsnC family transcriptional regulator [Myxococcota bacterium]